MAHFVDFRTPGAVWHQSEPGADQHGGQSLAQFYRGKPAGGEFETPQIAILLLFCLLAIVAAAFVVQISFS